MIKEICATELMQLKYIPKGDTLAMLNPYKRPVTHAKVIQLKINQALKGLRKYEFSER